MPLAVDTAALTGSEGQTQLSCQKKASASKASAILGKLL